MKDTAKKRKNSILKYFVLILLFIILCLTSYRILLLEQINGPEFVALIMASIFVCVFLNFLEEIQELSIGGNVFRLRDAKHELEEAIEQLKVFRKETYNYFLKGALNISGGFGSIGLSDVRAKRFLELIDLIKAAGVMPDLKDEIHQKCIILLNHHLDYLYQIDPSRNIKTEFLNNKIQYPEVSKILLAVNKDHLEACAKNFQWEEEKVESRFNESIDIYQKLLDLKKITS